MPNPHNPDTAEREPMKCPKLYFDIETEPLPEVLVNPERYYKADSRLKDPEKIKANLEEKAQDAALHPTTGRVLAIGYSLNGDEWQEIADQRFQEAEVITVFFDRAYEALRYCGRVIGWNILDFDLPFLVYRARVLGVHVPVSLFAMYRSRLSFVDSFVDLMLWAQSGRYKSDGFSLDRVAKSMGHQGKTGTGEMYATLLRTDPDKAAEYLTQDVRLLEVIGERMGL